MRIPRLLPLSCALLIAVLGLSPEIAAQQSSQSDDRAGSHSDNGEQKVDIVALPDSPGSVRAQSPNSQSQLAQLSGQSQPAQTQSDQNSPAPQRPVGTAAAEAPNVSAIAASQPAGVAVAPAKQHRVRTIVLRTGLILGAGVAIGTVVALSAATPSKPPGAH